MHSTPRTGTTQAPGLSRRLAASAAAVAAVVGLTTLSTPDRKSVV